jgi:isopenicillin-N epimerase
MGERVAAVDARSLRPEFLIDPRVTFLNHGSFGACPEPVMRTFQAWQRELEREPVEFLLRRAGGLLRESREALASYVGCRADEVVLVPNATVGMNMVARSLPLAAGDRVVITDHEYGAMDRLWQYVCERHGADLVRCELPTPMRGPDEVIDAFGRALSGGARVVSLSHIASPTGLVLPVDAVCRLAREAGATTVVDGAHVPGQMDLDLASLGADFYVGNCHKWLCSPKVAGFLYTDPAADVRIDPPIVSWGWDADELADRVHWQGTNDLSAFLSIPASIRYQRGLARGARTVLVGRRVPARPASRAARRHAGVAGRPALVPPDGQRPAPADHGP